MPRVAKTKSPSKDSTAPPGFEAELWLTDDIRGEAGMDEGKLRNPTLFA